MGTNILKKLTKGFTLAELLIALAILGVIPAFTIPKLLMATQSSKYKSLFKDTISAYSQAIYSSIQDGTLFSGSTSSNLANKFNAVKICSAAVADGCWDESIQGSLGSVEKFI